MISCKKVNVHVISEVEVGVGVRWGVDSFCSEVPSILTATCCNIHGI